MNENKEFTRINQGRGICILEISFLTFKENSGGSMTQYTFVPYKCIELYWLLINIQDLFIILQQIPRCVLHILQADQRGQFILFSVVFTTSPPATTAVFRSYPQSRQSALCMYFFSMCVGVMDSL